MSLLQGKRCLVTGASSGIGDALATELCNRQARVIGVSRRLPERSLHWPDEGERLAAQLDVSDEDAVDQAFGDLDGIDVLVLCAGSATFGRIGGLEASEFRELFEAHVMGSFLCVRAALPLMRPGSKVLCIGSITARRALAECGAYAAAKAGMLALTRALALELAPRGITANALLPGIVPTAMTAGRAEDLHHLHPVGRLGRGQDIADAVSWLLDAPWVTGASIPVDGGLLVRE